MALSVRPRGPGSQRRFHRNSGGEGGRGGGNPSSQHRAHRLFRSRDYGLRILSNLSELREKGKFCDVELVLDGKTFSSHKVVLAASCPYFEAMFGTGLSEGNQKAVEIRGVSPSIFEQLLSFMYKGELHITQENCQDLLSAANMLGLSDVVQGCCDFLQRELHPSNCVGGTKRRRMAITAGEKRDICKWRQDHPGASLSELIAWSQSHLGLSLPRSTLSDILKDSEKWLETPAEAEHLTRARSGVQSLLEEALVSWLTELKSHGGAVSDLALIEKARLLGESLGIFRFAELHSCTNLKLEAKRFFERRFIEVVQEEEFYDLPKGTIKNFLKSEGLSIDNEFQVFEAAMKWVLRNVEERRELVFEVLEAIRFPVISQKQLDQYVEHCPDQGLKEDLVKLLLDLKQDSKSHPDSKMADVRQQPRMCARKCIYLLGGCHRHMGMRFGEGYSLASADKLDLFRGKWSNLAPMSHTRSGPGTAVLNNLIYVVGGESDCLILASGEVLDPVFYQWASIADMVQPRCMMGLCALDGCLYAVGGWVGAELGDTVEKYDPGSDTWRLMEGGRMTVGRYAMGVLGHEGLIYVIGGYNDLNSELDLVESYNPVTNEWTTLAPLHTKRAYVGVAVLHDNIYAVGGSNEKNPALQTVERYSIEENKWTDIPPLTIGRVGASVVGVNGRVYVMGGRMASGDRGPPLTLDSTEAYDPELNVWTMSYKMPLSRCYAGISVI